MMGTRSYDRPKRAEIVRFSVDPSRPYSLSLKAAQFRRFPEIVDRHDGEQYRRLVYAELERRRRAASTGSVHGRSGLAPAGALSR